MAKCQHSGCHTTTAFANEAALVTHIADFHNQVSVCKMCGKDLKNAESVKRHEKMHNKMGHFKCLLPGCSATSWRKELIGSHLLNHKTELREVLNVFARFKDREDELQKAIELYEEFKDDIDVLRAALHLYKEFTKDMDMAAEHAKHANNAGN
ncbi:uncharacterized protein B0T15DRAFT_522228 [Chaetomium strumarium]|uniref:C2H2-type domain-containing protein n=1 Tax=Chaetomium strumarium TaxID=1170767 RepID=A0AAJ0M7G5_9PEZI|nr:hypothetical protein B0T15DRAFT_522228 [Chaetomium strumarium]